MEDWAIGQLASKDDDVFDLLKSEIAGTPDVIHVEQPWLFAFAQRFVAECAQGKSKLIYGSENIEHSLKRQIIEDLVGGVRAREPAHLVLECELNAVRGADLVCATSTHDATWLRSHASTEVILVPNGVRARETTITGIAEANATTGHLKIALYCASAHPPNISGFFEIFGRGMGCLSPDERLVVAGGAGLHIQSDSRFAKVPGLKGRYISAGQVSEECLQGLLHVCHALVLPITKGEGTNLKTAEALWAGRHVIATPVAMRGFEEYSCAAGVTMRNEAVAFRQAIREAMAKDPLSLGLEDLQHRRSLLWETTLKPLIAAIDGLEPRVAFA
jgi:hypothetical protein